MARVVAGSVVTEQLQRYGWRVESAGDTFVAVKGRIRATFAVHPCRPNAVYLFDVLERLPEVPEALTDSALDEPLEELAGFEVLLDLGDASADHVHSILSTLSNLNVALGGCGLLYKDTHPHSLAGGDNGAPRGIKTVRARPSVNPESDRDQLHAAWRATVAFIAEQAMATVDRRRRTIIRHLLDSVDTPPETPELLKARQAVTDAAQTLLHNNGRLRYPSAPLLRELDPGPRASDAAARHRAFLALKETGSLPALSTTVAAILEAADRVLAGSADPSWLVRAIEQDPSVSAKVIYRATRADVPVSREAKNRMSVVQATRLLGAQRVRSIALGCDLVSHHGNGPCAEFDYARFWQECTARAAAARTIAAAAGAESSRASARGDVKPEEAYIAGLLCQIGRLAFATALPKPYGSILRAAGDRPARLLRLEFERLKLDHHELAAEMMAEWGMPDLQQAVLHQESPELLSKGRERTLARIIQWTGFVWDILGQDGLKIDRAVVQTAMEHAMDLGVGSWAFADEFDQVVAAWAEEAELLDISAVHVPKWDRIVEKAC